MKVVVISHNQAKYIPDFERVLCNYEHVYVIDRPSEPYPSGIPAIYNLVGNGFLAGRMRDIGATCFPDSDILFLDGDKVPSGNLASLDNMPFECILLGVENDPRTHFFDGTTHAISLPEDPLEQINGCYSCGILYRKKLIKRFREINEGRIFHPCFDGTWGDEDSWNGDIINCEHIPIGCTSEVILGGSIGGCKVNGNRVRDPKEMEMLFKNPEEFFKMNQDYQKLQQLVLNFTRRCELRRKIYGMYQDEKL